jgi:integrase
LPLPFKDFHFHDLRHTFATRLRNFTDVFTVRDPVGHSKAETTDIYVATAFEAQRRAVEALCNLKNFHHGFTAREKSA